MARKFALQSVAPVGDGLVAVTLTSVETCDLTLVSSSGDEVTLTDATALDLKRAISRLRDALDLFQTVKKRGLEKLLPDRK